MSPETRLNVTELLVQISSGDEHALERLIPLVYEELRKLASHYLAREYQRRTLQTTDLVHEVYLKLVGHEKVSWENRAHFFGIASRCMRQILISHARKRKANKRGGNFTKVSLAEGIIIAQETDDQVLALNEALNKLEKFDERLCRIVELRYFTGLTIEETAEALSLSPATVKNEWSLARAWLKREINAD
jgi:RNA polymerase sigma factor (TIGR02999 family)